MGIQMPDSTIQSDPRQINDYHQSFLFYFIIMIPIIAGTICKAIRHHDYLAFLCASNAVGFFLLQFCLSKYLSLPKYGTSSQKFLLNFNIWFLFTAAWFGIVFQFAEFAPWQSTMLLCFIVSVCSSSMFKSLVVVDLVKYWKTWTHHEDETRLPETPSLDAGTLNCYPINDGYIALMLPVVAIDSYLELIDAKTLLIFKPYQRLLMLRLLCTMMTIVDSKRMVLNVDMVLREYCSNHCYMLLHLSLQGKYHLVTDTFNDI